jgi:predicted transcriptional regulator
MTLQEVQKLLEAQVLCGNDECLQRSVRVCFACDLISEMLLYLKPHSLLITSLTNAHVIHAAQVMDAKAILFVGGRRPDESVIRGGEANKIPLFTTTLLTFDCCGRLYEKGVRGDKQEPG